MTKPWNIPPSSCSSEIIKVVYILSSIDCDVYFLVVFASPSWYEWSTGHTGHEVDIHQIIHGEISRWHQAVELDLGEGDTKHWGKWMCLTIIHHLQYFSLLLVTTWRRGSSPSVLSWETWAIRSCSMGLTRGATLTVFWGQDSIRTESREWGEDSLRPGLAPALTR